MRIESLLLAMFAGLVGFTTGQQCERTKKPPTREPLAEVIGMPTPAPTPFPRGYWMFDKNRKGPLDK